MDREDETHFGYERVKAHEKSGKVGEVFHSVAGRYDVMNDLMSGGIHRLWKHIAAEALVLRPGQTVLDLAGGTGDLALKFARRVGPSGQVVLADINASMLTLGRDKLLDRGRAGTVTAAQADAESLPFASASFDRVAIGFGLRNVTDKAAALAEMQRVLKPGGRLAVLEFSKPVVPGLGQVYDQYSFHILPRLGKLVAGDSHSYRYLAESIRMHPDQDLLKAMLQTAGFTDVQYSNLTGGIVALHTGVKP